jgi:hypothetical protein
MLDSRPSSGLRRLGRALGCRCHGAYQRVPHSLLHGILRSAVEVDVIDDGADEDGAAYELADMASRQPGQHPAYPRRVPNAFSPRRGNAAAVESLRNRSQRRCAGRP